MSSTDFRSRWSKSSSSMGSFNLFFYLRRNLFYFNCFNGFSSDCNSSYRGDFRRRDYNVARCVTPSLLKCGAYLLFNDWLFSRWFFPDEGYTPGNKSGNEYRNDGVDKFCQCVQPNSLPYLGRTSLYLFRRNYLQSIGIASYEHKQM